MVTFQVGDGTNFVLLFAGALLESAEELLRMGLSPSEVVEGYEKACEKALEILPSMCCLCVFCGAISCPPPHLLLAAGLVCGSVGSFTSKEDVKKALVTAMASSQVSTSINPGV